MAVVVGGGVWKVVTESIEFDAQMQMT